MTRKKAWCTFQFLIFLIVANGQSIEITNLERQNDSLYLLTQIDSSLIIQNHLELTLLYFQKGDYTQSERNVRSAITMLKSQDSTKTEVYAMAVSRLSVVDYYKSDYASSLTHGKESLAILEEVNPTPTRRLMIGHNNLAAFYIDFENYKEALFHNGKAQDIALALLETREIDRSESFNIYHIRSRIFDQLNRPDRFYEESMKLVEIIEESEDLYSEYAYTNLVDHFLELDEVSKAEDYLDKAWSHFEIRGFGSPDDLAHLYLTQAGLEAQRQDTAYAIELLDLSAKIRLGQSDVPNYYVATCYQQKALLLAEQKLYDEAQELMLQAYDIVSSIYRGGHHDVIGLLDGYANMLVKMNEMQSADSTFRIGLRYLGIEYLGDTLDWQIIHMHKEGIHLISDYLYLITRYKTSISPSQRSELIEWVSRLFSSYVERYMGYINSFTANIGVDKKIFETYDNIIRGLWSSNITRDEELIYQFIQTAKGLSARLFLYDIELAKIGGVPDSITNQEFALRSELNIINKQLGETDSLYSRDEFSIKEREYRNLITQISEKYPNYYNQKFKFQNITTEELQSQMDQCDVLLDYYISDDLILLAKITKEEFVLKALNVTPHELKKYIRELDESISHIDPESIWQPLGQHIYYALLGDINLSPCPNPDITIIPHKFLFDLSFDIPLWSKHGRLFKTKYQQCTIDFSNINKEIIDNKVVAFAPGFISANPRQTLHQPFSRILVSDLSEKYRVTTYLDSLATESNFKVRSNNGLDHSFLHLATHGILDETRPINSYLALYRDSINDGKLTIKELYNTMINADIAIINACNSALGSERSGFGITSLKNAFSFSGCKTILSNLWEVDEKESNRLLSMFYDELGGHTTISDAIFNAREKYLQNSPVELQHPYYWAGMILYGDDLTVPRTHSWSTLALLALMMITLVTYTIWRIK